MDGNSYLNKINEKKYRLISDITDRISDSKRVEKLKIYVKITVVPYENCAYS